MDKVEPVIEAEEASISSCANTIQPMENYDPLEILHEEKRRREEKKQDFVKGLDATAKPSIHLKYEAVTMKHRLKTLLPLAKNPLSKITTQDWRDLQVTIDTSRIPRENDISVAQSTRSIMYDKYLKFSNSSEELQKKFTKAYINIQFLNAKVKALEIEQTELQNTFSSSGIDKQGVESLIFLLREKDERIQTLESSQHSDFLPMNPQMLEEKQQLIEELNFLKGENANLNTKNQVLEDRIKILEDEQHKSYDIQFWVDKNNVMVNKLQHELSQDNMKKGLGQFLSDIKTNSELENWLQQQIDWLLKKNEELCNSLNQKVHEQLESMKFIEKRKDDIKAQGQRLDEETRRGIVINKTRKS